MKILLVADGRSPITRGWIGTLRAGGMEVALLSTFPCSSIEGLTDLAIIPAAFSGMAGSQAGGTTAKTKTRRTVSRFRNLFMLARYWLGPLSLQRSRATFLKQVDTYRPDVVHALRVPFEGMLARVTPSEIPFIVSIWGNDLTLHAKGSPFMARETRLTLRRADGLLADAHRDLRLAREWGLKPNAPDLCIPGGGGIDLNAMEDVVTGNHPLPVDIPADVPVVINPRGFRPGSVRNDTFFQAASLVLREKPETLFLCAGMAGQPEALQWLERLGIEQSFRLLPFMPQEDLWRLFRRASVTVSISQHDGTPNSLLEAMALGCFPVVGDIESTREWITDGENGCLVNPGDVEGAARAILSGLNDMTLRDKARAINAKIIQQRADRQGLIKSIRDFYISLKS
ncbi:MAG: glycosyltransferase [Chloroflexi bacterium]|nr:glycosyltransferase [Chloroflexota bacterium]